MTNIAGRDERTDALLPGLGRRRSGLLSVLPRTMQERAARAWVRANPLPAATEQLLVDEVAKCWDGVPLPRTLDVLIDDARVHELLRVWQAEEAALDGPERAGRHLQVSSLLPVEAATAEGRAAVLLTPTYGAWQSIAPAMARRGYRVGLLDLRPKARRPEAVLPAAPGLDLRTLPSDGYARPLVRFATEGPNVIVALGDEGCGLRWGNGGLLGRPAAIGSTPFELARRAELTVLPVYAVREKSGHRLVVEKALRISDTGRGDADLDTSASRWLKQVSQYGRRHPHHYLGHLLVRRLNAPSSAPLFADAA